VAVLAPLIGLVLTFSGRGIASEHVIYSFASGNDGSGPNDLIADQAGNLYGTTYDGGPGGAGTVFRLSPPNDTRDMWTETILYSFSYSSLESGIGPKAGLVTDSSGNLFGSTWLGGPNGGGLVFELSPPSERDAAWSYQLIYDFSAANDGYSPEAPLTMDASGNLYGTTTSGGTGGCAGGCGTVFKLAPPSAPGGMWMETILYNFPGTFPYNGGTAAGVTLDGSGAVYGTTTSGGGGQYGTVFQMSPPKDKHGRWAHTVLYAFQGGDDGSTPTSSAVFDKNGSLNGVTAYGGGSTNCFGGSCGTVYKLTPTLSGPWRHRVLYTFGGGTDGGDPMSAVTFDAKGNLYSTTLIGGDPSCGSVGCGTIYRLQPEGGAWKETVLHRFAGGNDGAGPGGLTFGKTNTLFGVAGGGVSGAGVVFSVSH
jgi:uncharacterized repeat protein (TIGR03803 family)